MPSRDHHLKPITWSGTDVRRLQILSSRLVTSNFAGKYRSVFRGKGIEFEQVREYLPGDDVRNIDWNVTARTGHPFIKQYIEEREMTVMILLDQSTSLDCPTSRGTKSRVAAEICALLMLAAARNNDRVGLLTFTERVERYIPPAKGPRHAQRLIAELLKMPQGLHGTDLAGILGYLERVLRCGTTLFIVSDFLSDDFSLQLAAVARRHDVVAISLIDPADSSLPSVGLLQVAVAETGARRLIDTGNARVRQAYRNHAATRLAAIRNTFAAAGAEYLAVSTAMPPVQALTRFFLSRQQRLSR